MSSKAQGSIKLLFIQRMTVLCTHSSPWYSTILLRETAYSKYFPIWGRTTIWNLKITVRQSRNWNKEPNGDEPVFCAQQGVLGLGQWETTLRGRVFGTRKAWVDCCLCSWLAIWVNYLAFLRLGFLIYKCRIKFFHHHKVVVKMW